MAHDDPSALAPAAGADDATGADPPATDPRASTTADERAETPPDPAPVSAATADPGDADATLTRAARETDDAPRPAAARRSSAAHALEPTEALPRVAVAATADEFVPPRTLEDIVPSARFTAPPEPPSDDARAPRHRSSRHEQTGETGIYTERLRRETFELSVDIDLDAEDLPDLDPRGESGWQYVTGRHPPSLRRFLLFRALPAGLLIAITAWSWLLIKSGDRTGTRAGGDRDATTGEPVDVGVDETGQPELPGAPPPPEGSETIAALKLLDSYAETVAADETVGKTQLRHAIAPRKITVVNLWATWCQPCIRELPFLQEVFRVQEWQDVEFVPLLVFDPKPSRAAFRDHAAAMPPFDHFLADRDLSSGPKAALIADKRLPEKFDLPVTIVFDCHRKIHSIYRGAFDTPAEFEAFVRDVEALRAKLDTPACRPPPAKHEPPPALVGPPTAAVSTPPAPPLLQKPKPAGCGDGFCDRGKETCECAKDCPCSPKEQCKYRADGGSACVARIQIGGP